MLRMSLDKETLLPRDPGLPECPVVGGGALTDQSNNSHAPKPGKTHPLQPKNGLQAAALAQAPPPNPQQRMGKRRYSLGVGFKHPAFGKRRRRANSDSQSEQPNFLLGGNIFDPLNLNSLLDEEVSRALNAQTPHNSPLPARAREPVQILVPRDITDPLNLKSAGAGEEGAEGEGGGGGVFVSPLKSRRRHRNRHPHGGAGGAEPATSHPAAARTNQEPGVDAPSLFPPAAPSASSSGGVALVTPSSPLPYELNTSINCRDTVVLPRLPRRHTHPGGTSNNNKPRPLSAGDAQPRPPRKRRRTTSARAVTVTPPPNQSFHTPLGAGLSSRGAGPQRRRHKAPPPRKKNKYLHGEFSRYYGYRGGYGGGGGGGRVGEEEDPRLSLLRPDWFRGKRALDIGCGAGHVTLAIARRFGPAHILGLDRDAQLVHAARMNVRHFLSEGVAREDEPGAAGRPPLPPSPPSSPRPGTFPHNVTFLTGNIVAEKEAGPEAGLEEYDVILCLGVAKWVHLHHGDGGVARMFRRAYQMLRPGGRFILEPHPWSSYCHSKRTTETTLSNFRSICLRPENFSTYLTSTTGFSSYQLLTHTGYHRSIYLFHKGPTSRK